jgi:chitosanase
VYCQDPTSKAIFLKSEGGYTNVDIDCDGAGAGTGDCSNDQSGQSITAWVDDVVKLSGGAIKDLNTHHHTYVVFGNESPRFDPTKFGIEPLSVMAVVCGDKYILGIMGDSNGADLVGEASISLAKMCFPDEKITGDSGHSGNDVMFLAFPGKEAVPQDAEWGAEDAEVFEKSLWAAGDALLETLGQSVGSGTEGGWNGTITTGTPGPTGTRPAKPTKTKTAKPTKTKTVEMETETAVADEEDEDEEFERRAAASRVFRRF